MQILLSVIHSNFRIATAGIVLATCAFVGTSGQSCEAQRKATSTSPTAEITSYSVEGAKEDSGYTGPLHVLYDDRTEVVQALPSPKASTDKDRAFNAVGFSDIQLAADKQTLGWTINVENCCTSYPIPLSLVIFRHGRVLHTFAQGQMVWSWMFFLGGKRIAVVFGPTHGPEIGDYRLYDVQTGKLISEISGDEATQALKPDAPEWAQLLQEHLHNK